MLNITAKLMEEHVLILRYADLLEKRLSSANVDDQFWDDLNCISNFIAEYADDFHHSKEEDILFSIMQKPGVLSHCNPLPQMLHEHDQGRSFNQKFKAAILEKNFSEANKFGMAWVGLIREHIFKEDNVLYKFAEAGVSEEDKAKTEEAYSLVEKQKNSSFLKTKHENFEREIALRLAATP